MEKMMQFNEIMKVSRNQNLVLDQFMTDTLENCKDKQFFQNFDKPITYKFNSHGFRDEEWPDLEKNIVWCLGDSMTLGVGQPVEEAWPQMLQKMLKRPCLNIGEEGCSNDTIRLRAEFISENYKPTNMVIMWTFFHRRRKNNEDLHYDESDLGAEADLRNFAYNFHKVQNLDCDVCHLIIPNAFLDHKQINLDVLEYLFSKYELPGKENLRQLKSFKQLDWGRDKDHWGEMTSEKICTIIKEEYFG